MAIKLSNFDVSEYLENQESIAAYLSAVVEDGNPKLLLTAISDIAKARGMAKIASDSGLGRESLYKALNPESKPRFETILKVLNSLGVKIGFNAVSADVKDPKRIYYSPVKKRTGPAKKRVKHLNSNPIKPPVEKKKV